MTENELANQVTNNMDVGGVREYAAGHLADFYRANPEDFAAALADENPPEKTTSSICKRCGKTFTWYSHAGRTCNECVDKLENPPVDVCPWFDDCTDGWVEHHADKPENPPEKTAFCERCDKTFTRCSCTDRICDKCVAKPENPPTESAAKRKPMICERCGRDFMWYSHTDRVCDKCVQKPENPTAASAEPTVRERMISGVGLYKLDAMCIGSKDRAACPTRNECVAINPGDLRCLQRIPENPPVESAEATARETDGVPAVAPCKACTGISAGPIPGVLANGERCDACERFASDGDAKMVSDLLEACQMAADAIAAMRDGIPASISQIETLSKTCRDAIAHTTREEVGS